MLLNTKTNHKVPERGNIKRFGDMLAIKQDASAIELNRACPEPDKETWNQKKISLLDQKETIDAPLLQQISAALKIPVEVIQNFDEEKAVNIISNIFTSNDTSTLNAVNIQPTFNPIDKMIELYERMLHQQREMKEKLEKLLEKK